MKPFICADWNFFLMFCFSAGYRCVSILCFYVSVLVSPNLRHEAIQALFIGFCSFLVFLIMFKTFRHGAKVSLFMHGKNK